MNNTIRDSLLLRLAFALTLIVATLPVSVGFLQGPEIREVVVTPETQVDYGIKVATRNYSGTLRHVTIIITEGHGITRLQGAFFSKKKYGQTHIYVRLAVSNSGGGRKTIGPLILDTSAVDSETYAMLQSGPTKGTIEAIRYVIPLLPFLGETTEQPASGNPDKPGT